jgi:hypothetical protein
VEPESSFLACLVFLLHLLLLSPSEPEFGPPALVAKKLDLDLGGGNENG